ncbi:KpsF/GutQ family sugar-phosphate isomerase [Bacillus sp. P14.5]|uniref:KpsF/GutQ family sugar-phosphate isomerase n=1 Tax=Bacillus sp. P14.5 TaxID=1983400 RepID=UPI0031F5A2AD
MHPAEGLHGDLGMVTASDVVLALSNSGESDEVLNILPSIKRIGAKIIAFVGNRHSTLANKSDQILSIGKVKEACPLGLAPTTSTTLTLAVGDAIAVALLKARDFRPENFAIFHPGGSLGKKLLLTVRDIVDDSTNKNPTSPQGSKVQEVIFNMTDSGLGASSIVDNNNKLTGILTDGDIRRALTKGIDLFNHSIDGLYNTNPTVISEDILAAEALKIMEENKINVLPVVNDEYEPIAMIHLHDLTKLGL